MAFVKFSKSSSRAAALASTETNKVFFPSDSSAVVMGGKEYGMSPFAVRTSAVSATTGGTTTGRYYGVEKDSNGKAFVNVPWSNTTYTNLSLGQGYGTCSTAAATSAKVVTMTSYKLATNGIVAVRFSNAVGKGSTMNINSCGTKYIYHNGGQIRDGVINAGDTAIFIYNNAYYHLLGVLPSLVEIDLGSFFNGTAAQGDTITVTGGNDANICMHHYVATINYHKIPLSVSLEGSYIVFYYYTGFATQERTIKYAKFSVGSSSLTFVESGSSR